MSNGTTNTIATPPDNKLNSSELFTKQYLEVTEKYLFLHNILYNVFYRTPMMLMIYITLFYPTSIYYHINCFIITYIQEQLLFMLGHIQLHIQFNYAKPTITDMGLFCFVAYNHHYHNFLIFSQMNFYSYCNQYLESPQLQSSLINQYKSFKQNIICGFIPLFFLIPSYYNLLYLSVLTYILGLPRFSHFFIVGYLMKYYNVDNIHIYIYILYQFFHIYLQAITHLWYHTLESNKKKHFGLFLFYAMSFLEKIQIVSSKTHKIHHKHRLHNLADVEVWNDLYVPSFINNCADNIFKYITHLNVENNVKIKTYRTIKRVLYLIIVISFTYIIINII
jgi:hypothetical protein